MTKFDAGWAQRRDESVRRDALRSDFYDVGGVVQVSGVGRTLVKVSFPVRFVELPIVSCGMSLVEDYFDNDLPPEVTGAVVKWDRVIKGTRTLAWTGCTWSVRSKGRTGMNWLFHWSARGKAFPNPYPVKGDAV